MLNLFRRRGKPRVIEQVAAPPVYEQIWVRKRMPDPGAQNYAFETLDLPPQTVIGPAVAVRRPRIPTQNGQQPYFPAPNVSLQGLPQVSGGLISQPLFNTNYPVYGGIGKLRNNDVNPRAEIQPAGAGTL